jgi:uncharacterized membrane protein
MPKESQSPLPTPELLAAYNQAVPGAGDKLFSLWAKAAEQRMKNENKEIELREKSLEIDSKLAFRGQIFAFVTIILSLSVVGFAAYHNAQWIGSVVGGTTIISLTSIFVYGQKKPNSGQINKRRETSDTPGSN